jgi:hypothetical protein
VLLLSLQAVVRMICTTTSQHHESTTCHSQLCGELCSARGGMGCQGSLTHGSHSPVVLRHTKLNCAPLYFNNSDAFQRTSAPSGQQ